MLQVNKSRIHNTYPSSFTVGKAACRACKSFRMEAFFFFLASSLFFRKSLAEATTKNRIINLTIYCCENKYSKLRYNYIKNVC